MERVYNFAAGPATIDQSVLEKAQKELVCYQDKGMSVMEMSHRSAMYLDIYNETEALLRQLMGIPDNYKVLFLQGGATLQFSAVPLNLMGEKNSADLCRHRQFRPSGGGRSQEIRRGAHCRFLPGGWVHLHSPAVRLEPGCGLCLHHHQQHHLRHPLHLRAGYGQRTAGGRHEQQHSL